MIGSKRADMSLNRQEPYRQILSWGLNTLLRAFLGSITTDTHGQKLLHLPQVLPQAERCVMSRGQFDTELTLRCVRAGLAVAEVPVPIVEIRRQRNLMIRKILWNVRDIFRLWWLIRNVPRKSRPEYRRLSRTDVLAYGQSVSERAVPVGGGEQAFDPAGLAYPSSRSVPGG